jgi:hypothetical protein
LPALLFSDADLGLEPCQFDRVHSRIISRYVYGSL